VARPFLLVQLSDLHIGATWGASDPLIRAEEAAAAVGALPQAPDAVLVSGDLTENADPAEYAAAREALAPLGAPLFVLPGNHDGRGPLREAFGLDGEGEERIDYAADLGPLRLVALDSTVPGEVPGALDAEALAWLDDALAAAPAQPTLLAMHHPPLAIGNPAWEAINLTAAAREALAEVVARHPQVKAIVGGHLHASIGAVLGGRPVLSIPSTYGQAAPDYDDAVGPRFAPYPPYPPGFAIHAVRDGEIASRVVAYAP
jgi:3',5'-cyclic AMP phosphodiesterase CpdA